MQSSRGAPFDERAPLRLKSSMVSPKRSISVANGAPTSTLEGADVIPLASAYHTGERIADRYVLVRRLGEGGMGVVWVARNIALDCDVAIKMLRAGAKSDELERRMLKEAQAVARLGHPAILRVFDFGATHLGDPYIVMELLEGEDLACALERNGRLSPIKAVRILLPVLHALGTAHQKGIIHRDLKPDNIFLTNTDSGYVQPKVVDFGIVKTDAPEADRLTHLGTVLGTPLYLCPEQARGEDVDQRADVWSAAVVLYEMVTCRLPFEGGNYNALMRSIIEDSPPPLTTLGTGDAELWAIIARGLAKQPSERWPSMAAFGGALALWLLRQGESNDISGASLSAVWQQGAAAAGREDLYSGRPGAAAAASAESGPISAASLVGAPRVRRVWLWSAVALVISSSGALLLSSALEQRPTARPLLVPAQSQPSLEAAAPVPEDDRLQGTLAGQGVQVAILPEKPEIAPTSASAAPGEPATDTEDRPVTRPKTRRPAPSVKASAPRRARPPRSAEDLKTSL